MSEIRANTISDAAGTGPVTLTGQYAAKAWVNFNGTSTVAIRESGNVTSITDNGTGDYTTNFTTAMPDADFGYTCSGDRAGGQLCMVNSAATVQTTSTLNIKTFNTALVAQDCAFVSTAIFR